MNVLILAAGHLLGSADGVKVEPIWLSEIDGQLLIERQVRSLDFGGEARFIFAFRADEIAEHHVADIARQIAEKAEVVSINGVTAGAACTAMLALDYLSLDDELVVVSATDHIDVDYQRVVQAFRESKADAGIVTFEALHPRYSFVRTSNDGWVVEAAEKRPISRQANAGFYWYAKASRFKQSVERMILKDAHINGVFYISPSLNELVLDGGRVACWPIAADAYHPLKDQRQFSLFEHHVEEKRRHGS